MDKEEYIHQYATQLFNDRIRDSGSKGNIHFSIDDIIKAMWTSWDASYFYQWKSVQASLPPKGQCVNVMLEDGRYTNSFIMSDGTWAYNVRPIAWSEIKRPIFHHKPGIDIKNASQVYEDSLTYRPNDMYDIQKAFIACMEWFKNMAWKSGYASCTPNKQALVIFKNGKAKVYDDLRNLTYERMWGEVDRFAYIEDLTPEIED
jgi:hypothetical protein